jgi:hypothetical protein
MKIVTPTHTNDASTQNRMIGICTKLNGTNLHTSMRKRRKKKYKLGVP